MHQFVSILLCPQESPRRAGLTDSWLERWRRDQAAVRPSKSTHSVSVDFPEPFGPAITERTGPVRSDRPVRSSGAPVPEEFHSCSQKARRESTESRICGRRAAPSRSDPRGRDRTQGNRRQESHRRPCGPPHEPLRQTRCCRNHRQRACLIIRASGARSATRQHSRSGPSSRIFKLYLSYFQPLPEFAPGKPQPRMLVFGRS